ncbi:MAG: PD-(D/E)XK nuclease family protein [Clostridia bacterium]|nr:PD-(D/E)XK nuclease family protein [Clostridia bacterium]
MVHFIYGRTGSGKSEYIYSLAEKSAADRRAIVLVPDREAVMAERACAELTHTADIDVVTFSRLCNFIFRKKGGLCENYIGKGAKKIIMYNTLHALAPELKRYGAVSRGDSATVEKLLAARSELFRNMISPEELSEAAEEFSDRPRVSEKFSDIALIFSAYDTDVAKKWKEPDGALSRAIALSGDYFVGADVYIDSFFTFTKEQYKMLSVIFRTANEVYITLGYLPKYDREKSAFLSLSETDAKLKREAKESGAIIADDVLFERSNRYSNEEIAFLAENMYSVPGISARYEAKPEKITVMSCANVYAEADAVSADIARRVRAGARYRDMAIIMRETDDYAGIIDAALEKYEIPYFLSKRTDIEGKALIRFIISAYACVTRNFRLRDVIDYIKTDYAGITQDEADLLENYMTKWNIYGKNFTDDRPWVQNPRGYEKKRLVDEEETAKINAIRDAVRGPLMRLAGAIKTCADVREHAVLLYDFLTMMNIPETIKNDAAQLSAMGDAKGASELVQLWRVFCDCLDQTVISAGEKSADAEDFLTLLRMCFSETDIGAIPTAVDEVLVGGAAKIRPLSAKTVYIIGACDGVFPRRPDDDGIFSEYEKRLLEEEGIEFSSRLEKNMSDELYYFYCSACSPSDELIITYPEHDPSGAVKGKSVAVKRIEAIFPLIEEQRFEDVPTTDLIYGVNTAIEYAISSNDEFVQALREYFLHLPEYAERLKYSSEPLLASECRLSPENAEELFRGRNSASYSRIENYIKCHFQYFCKYELGIADNTKAGFSDANIGNFIHAALEAAAKYAVAPDADDEKLKVIIDGAAKKYITDITARPAEEFPPRLKHLTDYLSSCARTFALRIREEFKQSKFKPMEFELPIGGGGVKPIKIERDGQKVELSGVIDRVDGYDAGDGVLYLRVVDYKKSEKKFDLEKIDIGLDLQMLLYLFSLWENGEEKFGMKISPAGAMYVETDPSMNKAGESGADSLTAGTVSGFVVKHGDDELSLARAMEPKLEGKYSPVKQSKGNDPKKHLLGVDALNDLKTNVINTVLENVSEMRKGNADASPVTFKDSDPCKYCTMRPLCRVRTKGRTR